MVRLILTIALGYVAGHFLLELAGAVFEWSGRAIVRGFGALMGEMSKQRPAAPNSSTAANTPG
jgi:hypothetical protein